MRIVCGLSAESRKELLANQTSLRPEADVASSQGDAEWRRIFLECLALGKSLDQGRILRERLPPEPKALRCSLTHL